VAAAFEQLIQDLGDFPLDPSTGPAWIWDQAGENVLWASPKVDTALSTSASPALRRSLLPDLAALDPEGQPVRVQQLRLARTDRSSVETFTCLCRPVRLRDGSYGLMAVAIGASARRIELPTSPAIAPIETSVLAPVPVVRPRKVADLRVEPVIRKPVVAPVGDALEPSAAPQALTEEFPATGGPSAPPGVPQPAELPKSAARPARFIWQTDKQGRFVHLSRELMENVGVATGLIMGQTIAEAAQRFGLSEAQDLIDKLGGTETFSANPVRWPISQSLATGVMQAVPVEIAGMPVIENGAHAGFRGYGIVRLDRPLAAPVSASDALAGETEDRQDLITKGDDLFDRFGPAATQALDQRPAEEKKPPARRPLPIRVTETPAQRVNLDIAATDSAAAEAPGQTDAPKASEPPASAVPPRSLSEDERDAFRQIARSLGHLTSAPEPEATPAPQAETPAPLPETDAEPKPSARPVARAGSLDALKRDLARRSRARLGVKEPSLQQQEEPKRAAAPIIPFSQPMRRELRDRPDDVSGHWASIVEHLPLGMIVMQKGAFTYANGAALAMLGYPDLARFQTEASAETLFAAGRSGQAIDQFSVLTRNGKALPVDAQIQSITWNAQPATLTTLKATGGGGSAQVKAIEMDLIAARTELRELQSILDTATDGIIVVDGEGRILHVNRSAEALFGFDQNEIMGEKLTILLEPESHVAAMDYLEGIRLNGVRSILNDGRDVRGRERKGGALPLFMTISRVGDPATLNRFCVVLRDITHWKKVEADLTEAKRAAESSSAHKTDFLAKISHEIRTPMNAILGFSQVMMTESFGPLGNERYAQYAKDIHASGEHVISLVNDLLDLSKVAAGKLELNFASVDVNAVVASAIAMIQPQANSGKVILRTQLGEHIPMVVADERALRQIVLNLLSNAAKFTDAGGQVFVSTSLTDDGELVVRVRDTGIGMDPEGLKRAMQPFTQLESSKKANGTGLGLPLTKALTDANRARLHLESEPGKGTLAEVIFPSTRVLAE
jgi:PAS domain S-box-containing protein